MENNRSEAVCMEEHELDLFTLIYDIMKNVLFILLGAIAAAMITYVAVDVSYVPRYTTSATFIVGAKGVNDYYGNIGSAQQMAQMLQKILQSNAMNDILCSKMDTENIDAQINAEVVSGTNMLLLSVTADNPQEAFDVIKIVMDNYTEVSFYSYSYGVMNVLAEPEIPMYPDNYLDLQSPMKKAFIIGAGVCVLLFGILSYLSNTIKQEKEIEKKLDGRSLGSICYERKYKTLKELIQHKKGAVLVDNPVAGFSFVEGYKKLASKMEYQMAKNDSKVLVVTSVAENEGKSTVAANLAITYAEQGKKVILIDGDIRRPSQFLIFGLELKEENELGEYLKGNGNISSILTKGKHKGMYFLGGKNSYASSTEILQSDKLPKLLQFFKLNADIVIIDTPPAGLLADAQLFGRYSDGVLLVVRQNFMRAEDINEILDDFRDNHTRVFGIVLNGVQSFSSVISDTTGGYYGNYSHYGKYAGNKGR